MSGPSCGSRVGSWPIAGSSSRSSRTASGKAGPDLSIAFRGTRAFNLEVTRLRSVPRLADHGGPLLAKLRQLPPSVPNAVLIAIEGKTAEALDVTAATRALRARADAKDEAFFVARGFDGTRAFYERYLRLGAVLVACEGAVDDAGAVDEARPRCGSIDRPGSPSPRRPPGPAWRVFARTTTPPADVESPMARMRPSWDNAGPASRSRSRARPWRHP